MNTFKLGARVRHNHSPRFGVGIVTSMRNALGHIEIQFEGRKTPWTTRPGYEHWYEFLPEVVAPTLKLPVGSHVRHKDNPQYGNGRIRFIHPNGTSLAVEFENRTGLVHDCAGHGKADFCRWTKADSLELVNPFNVGDTVLICALDKRSDEDFWYTPDFAGLQGTVMAVHEDCVDVQATSHGVSWTQYIPTHDLTLVKIDPVEAVKAATPKVKTITFKSGSQCDRLVKYMLSGQSITPLKARALFGAERLAARILEIKQAGHKVKSVIKTDINGKVYSEYSLRNVGRVAA
ncbi:Helix-turn-helix domain-containing protein [Rhizobium mongolense subsp. loessense]|uniref:Helix-turn-helix domain-containing protein n=1 Tax=Rhizobium mongolense subsp. loessense TaxID=158890 RepID=A0A1G4T7K9_9HYPH|nr:helix-turn-helix domain-containing protein [Rhizobium mongolense]SCW77177.1 Helix-turn-helix domain-containing protein [Rhizobium mongolense subsp. loessense]